ncbi:MAG TPA: ATP-binding protein [Solirubrobacteraceae bacterium]|jgi:anti-sigma regulatory factor (Ser/Thr protein kinase)|nr:ATP-binding protein [Solirubrobacteraceae bacterium]
MALTDQGRGLDASFPAHPVQVPAIRRAVTGVASDWGADGETLTRIALAVTEAATNVVVHAYCRPPNSADRIYVGVHRDGACLAVSIRDEGVGMGPRADSPGLGLGLALMAHEAESCEIRAADGGGTEVLLRFELAADAPASWARIGRSAAGAGALA